MVADALAALHVLAALFQNCVGLVPQLLRDDGRDDLAALVLEHHPLLRGQELLLLGEQVDDLDLIAHIVSLVLWVGDHARHGGVGDLLAIVVAVALVPEQGLNLLHGVVPGGVQLEQLPYHGGLALVDHQPSPVLDVAEDAAVAQHHTLLDGLSVSELDPAGEFSQLILGDTGHDGQPQLAVLVEGVDVVVLEEHPHPGVEQFPRVEDGVQGVPGETGDLLGDDKVKESGLAVLHHAVEVLTLFGGGGGQALVYIAGHILPGGISADELLVVAHLVAQGVELLVAFGGHPGVEGHPKRNIVNGFCAQGLTNAVYIHVSSPL